MYFHFGLSLVFTTFAVNKVIRRDIIYDGYAVKYSDL